MSTDRDIAPATMDQLRLGAGFAEDERSNIVERFSKLNRRLKRFPADEVDMELAVKERDQPSQRLTLACTIAGFGRFVVTSTEQDLTDALHDVREDLWRKIDDQVNRTIDRSRA